MNTSGEHLPTPSQSLHPCSPTTTSIAPLPPFHYMRWSLPPTVHLKAIISLVSAHGCIA